MRKRVGSSPRTSLGIHAPRRSPARLSAMWAVVQHVSYEGQGNIAPALRRARLPSVNLRPFRGDLLPSAADLSGLIVLGAPSGSADDETTEHLAAERQLISDAVGLGLPVLGVCFGAQLIAVALGGRIVKDGALEVGMGALRPSRPPGVRIPSSVPAPRRSRSCIGIATATRCRQARSDWPPATNAPSRRSGSPATSTESNFTSRSTANWPGGLPTKCLTARWSRPPLLAPARGVTQCSTASCRGNKVGRAGRRALISLARFGIFVSRCRYRRSVGYERDSAASEIMAYFSFVPHGVRCMDCCSRSSSAKSENSPGRDSERTTGLTEQ